MSTGTKEENGAIAALHNGERSAWPQRLEIKKLWSA
jgi:hypothetical protein